MRSSGVAPLTDYMMNISSQMEIPISGTFELTPMCNFHCKMCYVRKSSEEVERHDRPMLTLEQWLRIAEEARQEGMLFLLLTGGEPLSWPYFWELYEALIHMGILVSINTNGSLIDDQAIERFRKLPPKKINITLYGASDETYEQLCGMKGMYRRVTHAIEGLKAVGIVVKLNCSLTPHNVDDLEEMVTYAKERQLILDVASYMFPPMRRDERQIGQNAHRFTAREAAYYRLKTYRLQYGEERYLDYLRGILEGYVPPPGLDEYCEDPIDGRIRCRAGKASFWITWDGWNTPCGMMTSPMIELVGRSFQDSWQELTGISREMKLSGVCHSCKNQQICHSCAAMALTETGSHGGIPVYLCQMVEAMKEIAQEELDKMDL